MEKMEKFCMYHPRYSS